jgi:sugar lactone lactonase YvrE
MRATIIIILVGLTYLLCWPVPIAPVAWDAPKSLGYKGVFAPNNKLAEIAIIPMLANTKTYGPEDFATSADNTIAVSSHTGDILIKPPTQDAFTAWVNTGGRPLGIEYDKDGNLIVADAIRGVLQITPEGEVTVLVDEADGIPVTYADDLDIASDGMIYFTDATTAFSSREYGGTLSASLLEILEHKGNGRLIQYNPITHKSTVLMDNLVFANGVARSADDSYVLVNETGSYRILRYWLKGDKLGTKDVFIDNLPGFPDNISRTRDGHFFVGLASPRSAVVDYLSSYPWLRSMVQRLPAFMRPAAQGYSHIIHLSEGGEVIKSLQDPSGRYPFTTGAITTDEGMYISSLTAEGVGFLPHKPH